jgi:beta-glucosidase
MWKNSPLFPFGFGLSYTSFVYSDLRLSTSIIKMDESLEASIRIKNTGKYDGEEIVQLFVRDMVATTTLL